MIQLLIEVMHSSLTFLYSLNFKINLLNAEHDYLLVD